MKLVIMRHGQAGWSAPSDALRSLTARGRDEVLSTAAQLKAQFQLAGVLASPYQRAQETGRLVADVLSCSMETRQGLTPEGDPLAVIQALPEQKSVLLASHMPLVSSITGLLCEGVVNSGPVYHTGMAIVLALDMPAVGIARQLAVIHP